MRKQTGFELKCDAGPEAGAAGAKWWPTPDRMRPHTPVPPSPQWSPRSQQCAFPFRAVGLTAPCRIPRQGRPCRAIVHCTHYSPISSPLARSCPWGGRRQSFAQLSIVCGVGSDPPPQPPLSDWANFSPGLWPIKNFSGAFGASQFRPKNLFGASNNSGSPGRLGPPPQPPHPPTPLKEDSRHRMHSR